MAVYTKISKKDISYINKKFDIEKILKFKGIKQGIENTNYLLKFQVQRPQKKYQLYLNFELNRMVFHFVNELIAS